MMVRIASAALGVACGFGSAVWTIAAYTSVRHRHYWIAFWYAVLASAYITTAVVISGRLVGRFLTLPPGFSILILAPIIAVPPAIHFAGWLKARNLIRQQRAVR